MTNRRSFLAGLAGGVAFCGCGMIHAARAQAPAAAPRPQRQAVTVAGRRVKTIDVHAHCVFLDVLPVLGGNRSLVVSGVPGGAETVLELNQRLAAMDQQKVDMEVLSVNPFWYRMERDVAAQVVRINNEKMAELCAANSERFAGFCSLTLQDPQLAVQELERAMKSQGLKGAAVGTEVGDVELGDPRFAPVWAKAEELGAVLFFHPVGVPELARRFRGNGYLSNGIGNPLATTIALSHLIFSGTMDRHPGLKVIAAHGGGFLPTYPDRSDNVCRVNAAGCDPAIVLKKKPSEYLKDIWHDSLVFTPEAIRALQARVGADRIVLGSDYPFPWQMAPVDHIFACDSLTDEQKRGVLGESAAKLLNIPL